MSTNDTIEQRLSRFNIAFTKSAIKRNIANDNILLSPYNVMACLSMVAVGSDTKTREEISTVLYNASAEELEAVVREYVAFNQHLLEINKSSVELKTANAVWSNSNMAKLADDYVGFVKGVMGSDVEAKDFADTATVDEINQWASDNTNKLITEIIEELNADDFAVLASALYFKGIWTNKFDKSLTEDKPFTHDNGFVSITKMMSQSFEQEDETLTAVDTPDYTAVAMTYGQKDQDNGVYPTMRLVVVRPKDDTVSAKDFLMALDDTKEPQFLNRWYSPAYGSVELPHMDMKEKLDIIKPLQDMGIRSAFEKNSADLSKMVNNGNRGLYVSEATHDVVFKSDEEGSEMAAVTMMRISLESVGPMPVQVDFKADRSYVVALQDMQTGAVIFMGAVNKPNEAMRPARKCGNEAKLRV